MPQIDWTSVDIDQTAMRYSDFVPRLYNHCLSIGMRPNHMLPSRVFCSDESQGYPVILLTKHFGSFPFNHGRVGGIMATDRHAPYAEHAEDLVIILASHVGYEAQSETYGVYRRTQTESQGLSSSCGAIKALLKPYLAALKQARQSIQLSQNADSWQVKIPSRMLTPDRSELLYLELSRLVDLSIAPSEKEDTHHFHAHPDLVNTLDKNASCANLPIGEYLRADMIHCRGEVFGAVEGHHHLKANLMRHLSDILCARHPLLTAALINSLVEFERVLPTLKSNPAFTGKRLFLIGGINIDISPDTDRSFPLTKFVPCAGYQQLDGNANYLDQAQLVKALLAQSTENPHQINLEQHIKSMQSAQEISLDTASDS